MSQAPTLPRNDVCVVDVKNFLRNRSSHGGSNAIDYSNLNNVVGVTTALTRHP